MRCAGGGSHQLSTKGEEHSGVANDEDGWEVNDPHV